MAYLFMQFLRLPSGISENILRKECRSQYGGYWLFFNEKGVYFLIPNQRFPNEIARNVKKMVGFPTDFWAFIGCNRVFQSPKSTFFRLKAPKSSFHELRFIPTSLGTFLGLLIVTLKITTMGVEIRFDTQMRCNVEI